MNFGTLVIIDGSHHQDAPSDAAFRRGLVRIDGALAPPLAPRSNYPGVSFVVELNYSAPVHAMSGGLQNVANMNVSYAKRYRRLASEGNPLKDAKNFVANFAGCDEAHKLRKRAIALSRIKRSISGEVFRFPLEAP